MKQTSTTKQWDMLSQEQKTICIEALIAFFEQERDEKIGVIAAEEILDCILKEITVPIYNNAIATVKELVTKNNEDLQTDIDLMIRTS